jgi:hypothetical protein
MLNRILTHELVSSAQFEQVISTLDAWLQLYTEAVFILFIVVIGLVAWLALIEVRDSGTSRKAPSHYKPRREPRLLQTGP